MSCKVFPYMQCKVFPYMLCRNFPYMRCGKIQYCRIQKNPIDKLLEIPYTDTGIENGFARQVAQGLHHVEKAKPPYFLQSWIRKNRRLGCRNYGIRSAVFAVDTLDPAVYTGLCLLLQETWREIGENVGERQHALRPC